MSKGCGCKKKRAQVVTICIKVCRTIRRRLGGKAKR